MTKWGNLVPPSGSFASWLNGKFFRLPAAFWILCLLMLAVALLSWKGKQLTVHGAIAEFFVGMGITWPLGFGALFTMLFFFVAAGLVGKATKPLRSEASQLQKKGGTRDAAQVFANGGLALLSALLYAYAPSPVFLVMFGASVSESMADTMAGEIGILSKEIPVSVLTGKPMPKGESGAVTTLGLLASLVSALLCAMVWQSSLLYPGWHAAKGVAVVTSCAFLGGVFDSVLGATCQALYRDEERGKLTERDHDSQGKPLELEKGLRWMDNDMVNFLSNLFATCLSAMVCLLIRW